MHNPETTLETILPELHPNRSLVLHGIDSDSRRLPRGGLFFALQSRHGPGEHFLRAAWEAGAAAVILEGDSEDYREEAEGPVWTRPDARALLGLALRRWYHWDAQAQPTLIGVTGTNGKSSVSRLIAQLAPSAAYLIGTLGHGPFAALQPLPNTTPEAVELWRLLAKAREAQSSSVAMEVSSHALALGRVAAIPFAVAVFTNLTQDHLDFHGDMANYGTAKAKLFAAAELRVAVLNADDPFSATLQAQLAPTVQVLRYGFQGGDLRVLDYHPGASGTLLTLQTPAGERRLRSPLIGRSNTYNLLAALTTATSLGWHWDEAQIAGLDLPAGRYQCLPARPNKARVMVDYAHTPDALERVLEDLRSIAKGKIWVVFGCGGERDRDKRAKMGAIAARLADRVIVTNDNPRGEDPERISQDILAGIPAGSAVLEHDRAKAITFAIDAAAPEDWVLIAGKGHESYQEIAGHRHPFDDVTKAREALAR